MSEPVLHQASKKQLDLYFQNPTHALAIVGPEGMGKLYVAKYIASQLLTTRNIENNPYVYFIESDKQTISIDQIRGLRRKLQLKIPGDSKVKQVVVIRDAQELTIESQNALLKILEEPPQATAFLLTVQNTGELLSTIVSRLVAWHLQPLSEDILRGITSEKNTKELEQKVRISAGRPGLFNALINDKSSDLIDNINTAKQILASDKYERLLILTSIKDKQELARLLDTLIMISHSAVYQTIQKAEFKTATLWQKRLKTLNDLSGKLQNQASIKLISVSIALNL